MPKPEKAERKWALEASTLDTCPECGEHGYHHQLEPDGDRWECSLCRYRYRYVNEEYQEIEK